MMQNQTMFCDWQTTLVAQLVRCTRLNKKKFVRRPLKCCGPLLLFLTYDSLGIVSSSDVRDQDECSNSHRIQRHIVRDYRNSDMYVGITSLVTTVQISHSIPTIYEAFKSDFL